MSTNLAENELEARNGHHADSGGFTSVRYSIEDEGMKGAEDMMDSGVHAPGAASIKTINLGRVYRVKGTKKGNGQGQNHNHTNQPDRRTLVALDGVNLEVYRGELFGLLGPNGAGKTTLIKILTTLLAPTSGSAYVEGYDVLRQADQVRRIINMVSGGETSGYGLLKVHENLWMFSQFYGLSWKDAYRLIDEMLKVVELEHKRNAQVSSLSTGERQRMNFCRGFITDPTVLFLDEPTLGLDVHAARIVRDFTRDWLRKHPERTILLTTHYMAEADEICDRIAIIDHGRVLACNTPANLKKMLQKQPIFEIIVSGMNDNALQALATTPGVVRATSTSDPATNSHVLNLILEEESVIGAVVNTLTLHELGILSLQKHEPTLEDVFIKLVGRRLNTDT